MKARVRFGVLIPLLLAFVLPAGSAQAQTPGPEPLTTTVTVTQTDYDANGAIVSQTTSTPVALGDTTTATDSVTATAASSVTIHGTSTASGCRKVQVLNEARTATGLAIAYQFINWTRWCWTRSTQTVYNVTSDYWLGTIDPFESWKGIVSTPGNSYFYDYGTNDGHPRSAYRNYRMGRFDNCIFIKFGCVSYYPWVVVRSYYNGTYSYTTGG